MAVAHQIPSADIASEVAVRPCTERVLLLPPY
jgi:hypothetical protein